jgi:hypothetical protein
VPDPTAIITPETLVTNGALVWDGDSWVTMKLTGSQLADDVTIADDLTVGGDITIGAVRQPKITRGDIDDGPPGSPVDGDIWIAEDVGGENSGVAWMFVYNADSSATHKWEFIGGAPLSAEILTSETANSASYGDATTAGPSVNAPRSGDYEVTFSADRAVATDDVILYTAVKLGTAATSDDDAIAVVTPNASGRDMTAARTIVRTVAQNNDLKLQYKRAGAAGGTAIASRRNIQIRPRRVS